MRRLAGLILLFALASCGESDNGPSSPSVPVIAQLDQSTPGTVSVRYGFAEEPVDDASVARMFDRNDNTRWVARDAKCEKITLQVNLGTPRYITGINLVPHGEVVPKSVGIAFHYPGDEERGAHSYTEAELGVNKQRMLEIPTYHYARLFLTGSLRMDLMGCTPRAGRIEISEIRLQFSSKPTFSPAMSIEKLLQHIKRDARYSADGFWKFEQEGDGSMAVKFAARDEYLAHLIYFALNGNEEAKKLFLSYAPPGTASGEDISYMKSWYTREEEIRLRR